ncbi:MAG TPA: hypothetical protein VE152_10955, partial [Acidimicrobiales bacterium]|nr:hypothetical protein [Acidimicrobiales bacterium]
MRDERFGDPDRFLDDEEADLWRPVGTMTTAPAVVATEESTLRAVAELMAAEGVGAAIVAGPEGPI